MEETIKLKNSFRIVFTKETEDSDICTLTLFSPDGDYFSVDMDKEEFYQLTAISEKIYLDSKLSGLLDK